MMERFSTVVVVLLAVAAVLGSTVSSSTAREMLDPPRLGQAPRARTAGYLCYLVTEEGRVFDLSGVCGEDSEGDRSASPIRRDRPAQTLRPLTIPRSAVPPATGPLPAFQPPLSSGASYADDIESSNY